jgi:hypothetical protein
MGVDLVFKYIDFNISGKISHCHAAREKFNHGVHGVTRGFTERYGEVGRFRCAKGVEKTNLTANYAKNYANNADV